MRSQPVAALLVDLDIVKSHSRPHVSSAIFKAIAGQAPAFPSMTTPIPATIAGEVHQELIKVLSGLTRYIDDESIALRRLRGRIDQLTKVDAARGWAAKATYSTLFGDKKDALAAAQNALRLTHEAGVWGTVATNVYMNIGEFDAALRCLIEAAHPHRGLFSTNVTWLIAAGGLRTALEYCGIAESMGIEVPALPINLPAAIRALDAFDSPKLSDADLAGIITAAAGVLFDRRQLTSDQQNMLVQYDDGTVCYRFPLALSAEMVTDLMLEMSDRLANRETQSVAFGVSFFPHPGVIAKVPLAA